ncbi:hypothetical protein [Pseudolysinimonas sp.]|uniref:hypothetical protein n=1 Tax=Pseudolysinimonas sp. TaxID=2680009 RepID=UPI00286C9A37|nr:hypothetical protein [Pseudolysinimonas sp.]
MGDKPAIDPHYAAQFQRGYDGPVLTSPASAPAHSTRTDPVRIPGGPPASAVRVPDPPPLVLRPAADEEPVDVDEPEPDRSNRIVEWTLLALGAGLLLAAAWVFQLVVTDTAMYLGQTTSEEAALSMVRSTLPGPLLVAGIVAISTWLVLHALRPRSMR